MAGSPAIDRGTLMDAPLVDYTLAPRPQGRGVDIGRSSSCHESRVSERSCGDFRAGKTRG